MRLSLYRPNELNLNIYAELFRKIDTSKWVCFLNDHTTGYHPFLVCDGDTARQAVENAKATLKSHYEELIGSAKVDLWGGNGFWSQEVLNAELDQLKIKE